MPLKSLDFALLVFVAFSIVLMLMSVVMAGRSRPGVGKAAGKLLGFNCISTKAPHGIHVLLLVPPTKQDFSDQHICIMRESDSTLY